MEKVILFGNGQMAEIAHCYITRDTDMQVVGFTVDRAYMEDNSFLALPLMPFEEIDDIMPPSEFKMFVPIGAKNMNRMRAEKYAQAKNKGYTFINYVHSNVTIWPETELGENCFIFENNVIQPFTKIGNNVVLWSGNHIGHHTTIGDHCFIASHVVVSGRVTVKPYCYFGVNATIRDGITIEEATIVGAGALMLRGSKPKEVYVGPRPKLHEKNSDDVYVA